MSKLRFAALSACLLFALGIPTQLALRAYQDTLPGMALTCRIAYGRSPWFGPAFLGEQQAMNKALHYAGRWLGDYHGRFFNIADGWRVVTDTPATWQQTIWFVGSSTVRDTQVPDALTKASYLQRLFKRYRVLNRADNGLSMPEQISMLEGLAIQPGDLVVMYGGGHERDAESFKALVRRAAKITRLHGASFWFFLEEHIWTMPLSADEQALVANTLLVPSGEEGRTIAQWRVLQSASLELAREGLASYDLTHSLDALRGRGVITHYDHTHTNEYGNEAIARAIYDWITVY